MNTNSSPFTLLGTWLDRVAQLQVRPAMLFFILFALDSLVQPYAGVRHDAQLYAVQVLNRLEAGHFDGDMFFLYGSQDRYSLFSLVAAPLAGVMGLFPSFFLMYLAGRALLLWGLMRLVRVLVPDTRAAVLALIFFAITNVPYGGLTVFHVNERFLTPRLLAAALVLIGLERMLARRHGQATALFFTALLLHPLIAFGGVLIACVWHAFERFGTRTLLAVATLGLLGSAGILFFEPLGLKLFGFMDDHWKELVLRRSPHCFPSTWNPVDWIRIGVAFVILAAAARHLTRPLAVFCWAVGVAGLVGLATTVLAAELPYALLLQGQPFRVLWIVQLLAIPLGFGLGFRWIADPRPAVRLSGVLLLTCLVSQFDFDERIVFASILSFPIWALLCRWCFPGQKREWAWLGLLGTVITCAGVGLLTSVVSVAVVWDNLVREFEPLEVFGAIPGLLDKGIVLLVCVVVACRVQKLCGPRLRAAAAFALLGLVYQGVQFGFGHFEWYCRSFRKEYESMRFVQQILEREHPGRQPTVYWTTDIKYLWLYLQVDSYFHLAQTPNNIFSRGEALEAERRANLVSRFEIQHLRTLRIPGEEKISDDEWHYLLGNFRASGNEPRPSHQDLTRLRGEPRLDYIVTKCFLGPDFHATNGEVFIYSLRDRGNASTKRGNEGCLASGVTQVRH